MSDGGRPSAAPTPVLSAAAFDGVDSLVGLARTLRGAGVVAAPDRVHAAVEALAALEPARRRDVYWAGRLTLCGSPDDLARYDRVFDAYFGDRPSTLTRRQRLSRAQLRVVDDGSAGAAAAGDRDPAGSGHASAASSEVEVLRHRDIATMTSRERAELQRLLAAMSLPGESRHSPRRRSHARGRVDGSRTLRAWLRTGGEPARLRHHRSVERPRKVVLLVDVSGSMDLYADALLRFAHAAARRGGALTEVFALGTRLTRITREMALHEPDAALAAVAEAVPDSGGGTRLGLLLKEFLDRWGHRGAARGAVVVVLSDGWERGDPRLLGQQVARLQRFAHRVVWSNPRKAAPGFAPLAGGMAAALPHCDDFVEGHSLAALEHLAEVVRGRAASPARAGGAGGAGDAGGAGGAGGAVHA